MDLIFLHGLGQNPSSWNETLSFLPQCIKAYCPDLLNLCEDKVYEKIYLAFENYVDDFSNPINLCGISLGAVLALNYTLNHADKVSSLVLIAPQYKMPKLLLRFQNIVFRFMPDSLISKDGIAKQDIIQLTNSMRFLDFEQELKKLFQKFTGLRVSGREKGNGRERTCSVIMWHQPLRETALHVL